MSIFSKLFGGADDSDTPAGMQSAQEETGYNYNNEAALAFRRGQERGYKLSNPLYPLSDIPADEDSLDFQAGVEAGQELAVRDAIDILLHKWGIW